MTMEVSVNDIASKIMESEAGPALCLSYSLKLPINELLQALQQFQQKSREPVIAPPKVKATPELKELAPAMQPGLVAAARPPAPFDATQPPPTEEPKPNMPAVMTQPSAWPSAGQNITWENEIADLHPGRDVDQHRWETTASSKKWTLPDEDALLQKLLVERCTWVPLVHKAPTQRTATLSEIEAKSTAAFAKAMAVPRPADPETRPPPSAPPPAASLPSTASAPASAPAAAQPPPAVAPESTPETGSRATPGPPPAAAPPPPPAATGAASIARVTDAGPPGLPAPKPAPKAKGSPAAPPPGGSSEEQSTASDRARAEQAAKDGKECKQQ